MNQCVYKMCFFKKNAHEYYILKMHNVKNNVVSMSQQTINIWTGQLGL